MLPFSWEENIGLIDDSIVIMSSSPKERARKLQWGRSILSPLSDERREPTRADLCPTAALLEKVGEQGVRYCDSYGLRVSHFFRRVREQCPLSFLLRRHSYLTNMANLAHRGYRIRWGISRTDEEAGDRRPTAKRRCYACSRRWTERRGGMSDDMPPHPAQIRVD